MKTITVLPNNEIKYVNTLFQNKLTPPNLKRHKSQINANQE